MKVDKLIAFLKEKFPEGIQMFDTKNVVGDHMETIYEEDGITVDYCCGWGYIEIFGVSKEDFDYIEKIGYISETPWVTKKLTKKDIEKMANEIADMCHKNGFGDTIIYFNNKRMFVDYYGHKHKEIEENIDPHDYFKYTAYHHILSMSFEGGLYDYIDRDFDAPLLTEILKKYELYWELGESWNLTVYPSNDDMEIEYTVYEKPEETRYVRRWEEQTDVRLKGLVNTYNLSIAAHNETGRGSCIIGDGIKFKLDGHPYFFSTNYNQSDVSSAVITDCKLYLVAIGATEIYYDCGRLD